MRSLSFSVQTEAEPSVVLRVGGVGCLASPSDLVGVNSDLRDRGLPGGGVAGSSVVFLCAGWRVPLMASYLSAAPGAEPHPPGHLCLLQHGHPQTASSHGAFASVTLADVSLTIASHVTEPSVSLAGDGPGSERCGPVR